ncbi:MAG TPA: outer membrane protein assembly factor BamA [Bryobacteraceae bacterium]|nr:outer membrane protein assembly factor BamA [Bryobacteraceae bacterium]
MKCPRLGHWPALVLCSAAVFFVGIGAEKASAQNQQTPQQQQPQQPKPPNPFETVPTAPSEQRPAPTPPPPPAAQQPSRVTAPGQPPENIIEAIEFRGARRVRQDTLQALIFSKRGDPFNEDSLHRDFMALWNSGRFDDLRIEREPGKQGWIIRFVVVERPVVRTIKYEGNKSVTQSDILDRYKDRKVGLVVESQYDPAKVQRAKNVLLDLLAERGHLSATVDPQIRRVPPSSLEITFKINEGPKVKVGNIEVTGNQVFSDKQVIRAMKNLHPYGLPHSILFESVFAKTYDPSKLDEDKSRVQVFYQEHGYFTARVTDSMVNMRKTGGEGVHIPLIHPNKRGTAADVTINVEEGKLYHLNNITFTGVKFFRTPEALMTPLFGMQKGDVFSTAKLRKGLENMRKLYGDFGYIDFVAEPSFDPQPDGKMDMSLSVDEGKQFFVRRIDFTGNTTTRDKVIRRQLLIDEGQIFNNRLWELSILKLNQLGYFEPLKAEDAADVKRDTRTNTVDITLKVKERGKNSIQLNGGVSAIAGSFIGASYSTNNFLGLGETLGLSSQVGTRLDSVQFSFTEPYFLDRALQTGFTLYVQRYDYNQAQEASILAGTNLIGYYNALGTQNLLNYVQNGYGGTVFASYPLKRSFARVGLTYGYNISNVKTLTNAASNYFTYIDFEGVGGPNQLSGIRTSTITPSYTYNSVNNPINPTGGRELFFSLGFSGSALGGNVNTIQPTLDAKYFHTGLRKSHVIGLHLSARMIIGYGGKTAPPFSRFFMGGENDIRGFYDWTISPIVYLPSDVAAVQVYNADGTLRTQKGVPLTMTVPSYQVTFPGGDTSLIGNFEYRIPIVGPVTLAIFADAGIDRLILPHQLHLNPERTAQLNAEFPQAGFTGDSYIQPGSQKLRTSTGLELQVLMPVVNAPFRVYWAYNPTRFESNLLAPIVADRSYFPNTATYKNAINSIGAVLPYSAERSSMFRFTVGRTF